MDIVACRLPTTELKFHNLSSLVAYVGFGRPPSFVLARKDKHKNWEARILLSQGFQCIHIMIAQKVLQIKTKYLKENARKKKLCWWKFNIKISNFVLFSFDFSDIYYIVLRKKEIKYFHDQSV